MKSLYLYKEETTINIERKIKKMKEQIKAHVAILIQVSIIGLSYLFVKEGLGYADPMTQLSHRFIIASIGIWLLRLIVPHNKLLTKEVIKDLLPLGIFYPVLFFSLQTLSLSYITTLEAGIISATIPIIIMILAIVMLKEKPNAKQKLVVILSFGAVIYINLKGQGTAVEFSLFGTSLMFLSALSSGLYTITAKKVSVKYETIDMTTFMLTFGMIVFTTISFLQHILGFTKTNYFEPLVHSPYMIAVLYLGLLSSLGSAFLSNYAIHHVNASTIGLFSNLSPVITILAGILILGEPIYSYQIIGILIIIILINRHFLFIV